MADMAGARPCRGSGSVNDQHRAGEVRIEDTSCRIIRLPVASMTAALDHLDRLGLCACWVAPYRRRCRCRRRSP